MADAEPIRTRSRAAAPLPPAAAVPGVSLEDYRDGFGEDLSFTLNVDNWRSGRDLSDEYRRIEEEVRVAVERETDVERRIRDEVFPRLAWGDNAPPGAGLHPVTRDEIEATHRGLLFNGAVEACDGTSDMHDSLALTIHQLGVSLVSYRGDLGTWCQRLFRRDLRLRHADPVADALEALERRRRRGGFHATPRDQLSELASRGLMSFAERAVLLRKATAPWRMGHGSPAPLELIGAGFTDLVIESIRVIRELIEGHRKFVFVPSEPDARDLLMIGQALRPLEYAIVATLRDLITPFLENWHAGTPVTVDTRWDGRRLSPEDWVCRFRDEVAPQVVVGLYRATLLSPPHLFYAHAEHSEDAARIAIADSVFQEQRGLPNLIDLADKVCGSVYGGGSLKEMATAAYAAVGAPFRYQSERTTRRP